MENVVFRAAETQPQEPECVKGRVAPKSFLPQLRVQPRELRVVAVLI